MLNILTFRASLSGCLSASQIKLLFDIITAFFRVSYSITTRSLSRYTDCSLRTLFRFLKGEYDWINIRISLFKSYLFNPNETYILVADETVEGKSRDKSFGIDRFYSSTVKIPIPGICIFGCSLIKVSTGDSYFLGASQVVKTPEDKARIAVEKAKLQEAKKRVTSGEKRQSGRKSNTKNKVKQENDTPSYRVFKPMFIKIVNLLRQICIGIKVQHLVVDSAYGTKTYLNLAKQKSLFIVSKLKCNSNIVIPYTGPKTSKKPRIYGAELDKSNISSAYLKETIEEEGYVVSCYQLQGYVKTCMPGILLNIVIKKTLRLSDKKTNTSIYFSSDLNLKYDEILNFYHLRFQIEFDFRDAKQAFGLSDFKNYKKENLTNFFNLSFTMCLVSKIYIKEYRVRLQNPKISILDIKLIQKARFIAQDIIKLMQKNPKMIFNDTSWQDFMPKDLINTA